MAAILHLVRTNERIYAALMAELEERVGEGVVPTYEQVCHLPYLQATITEGSVPPFFSSCPHRELMLLLRRLRFHATTAIGLPRTAPAGGVLCGGYLFPEGVRPFRVLSFGKLTHTTDGTFRPRVDNPTRPGSLGRPARVPA